MTYKARIKVAVIPKTKRDNEGVYAQITCCNIFNKRTNNEQNLHIIYSHWNFLFNEM